MTDLRVKYGPIKIIVAFWLFTFVIYIFDFLVEYPGKNDFLVSFFVLLCVATLSFGYCLGVSIAGRRLSRKYDDKIGCLGIFLYVVTFYPTVVAYTGGDLSGFFELFLSPSEAYKMMADKVSSGRSERAELIILKLMVSPLVISAIPYFSLKYFTGEGSGWWVVLLVFLYFSMSVFRGTDKETFDVFILIFSVFLVARPDVLGMSWVNKKLFLYLSVFAFSFFLVFSNFSYRKADRLEDVDVFCFKDTLICNDISEREGFIEFGGFMLVRYLGQGYHGLALAFDGDFSSGYGFGHSRSLQYIGVEFLGSDYQDNMVSQLDELGWASRGLWSTGFVWLANDVPLYVVPLVVCFIGFLLGASWKLACYGKDLHSTIVFSFLFFSLIYMPGNLQLAQSGDLYIGFVFWLILYIIKLLLVRIR